MPLEGAIAALGDVVVLLLFLGLLALLALDREAAIGDLDIDVLFVETRKLGRNLIRLVALGDVDGRRRDRLREVALEPRKRTERSRRSR